MPDHQFRPPSNASRVAHAGTYRRVLPVSLARLYENALDWEHLPHVHSWAFDAISCLDAGAAGWRAVVIDNQQRESTIELILERDCRRWRTRVLKGSGAGNEIWTQACVIGTERVDVVVDFFVPDVDERQRRRVGETYARLYARLYDDDAAMMTERQRQLDRRLEPARDADRTLLLGPREALALPREIEVGGREFVLVEVEGVLAAFPRQCPHQLGPLSANRLDGGVVTCPWHGDRFHVLTGANLSGRACVLSHRPEVKVDAAGNVRVRAAD